MDAFIGLAVSGNVNGAPVTGTITRILDNDQAGKINHLSLEADGSMTPSATSAPLLVELTYADGTRVEAIVGLLWDDMIIPGESPLVGDVIGGGHAQLDITSALL